MRFTRGSGRKLLCECPSSLSCLPSERRRFLPAMGRASSSPRYITRSIEPSLRTNADATSACHSAVGDDRDMFRHHHRTSRVAPLAVIERWHRSPSLKRCPPPARRRATLSGTLEVDLPPPPLSKLGNFVSSDSTLELPPQAGRRPQCPRTRLPVRPTCLVRLPLCLQAETVEALKAQLRASELQAQLSEAKAERSEAKAEMLRAQAEKSEVEAKLAAMQARPVAKEPAADQPAPRRAAAHATVNATDDIASMVDSSVEASISPILEKLEQLLSTERSEVRAPRADSRMQF